MAYFREVIYLMTISGTTTNDAGDSIDTYTERKVYANEKSVRQSELYQAMASGLKPELMFEIHEEEYAREKFLRFEGTVYEIIRAYRKDDGYTELIVSGLVQE